MKTSADGLRLSATGAGPLETKAAIGQQAGGLLFRRATAIDLLAITLLWGLAVLLVNPVGDFPLNDDWAMGETVKHLVETGSYRPSGWTSMPMITQVYWGALFCLPKGFSFTALRCSTLAMSWLGVLGVYLLIRYLGRSRLLSVLCSLALAFNPIYFALSNTFMTDVPFTALVIWSSWFLVRHLQNDSLADLLLGTALAVAATLCRQLGLCLPLAFGVALLLKRGLHRRWIVRSVLPLLVVVAALGALQYWLASTGRLPAAYNEKTERVLSVLKHPLRVPLNTVYYGWSILMYWGLFLLPVTLPVMLSHRYRERYARHALAQGLVVGAFVLATAVRLAIVPALMPVHRNIIIPQGIGPVILRDSPVMNLPNLPPLPSGFWLAVTVLSLLGAALLLVHVVTSLLELPCQRRRNPSDRDDSASNFFLFAALTILAPLLLNGFFDRYLVPVTVFGFGLVVLAREDLAWRWQRGQYLASILLLVGFAVFGIAGTRDYLESNRTRWRALDALLAQKGITPDQVDGGFEFNGWYKFKTFTNTNWWQVDDSYAITFGELKGFTVLQKYGYRNWLPPRDGHILVLKRNGAARPTPGSNGQPAPGAYFDAPGQAQR
jgi:4-amino-4-deoxy-L-arabinose transferase-like glycosyltransferase